MEKFILTSVSLENSSQASLLFIVSLHSSLQAAPLFTHDKFQTENIAPMLKMFFSEPCKFVHKLTFYRNVSLVLESGVIPLE